MGGLSTSGRWHARGTRIVYTSATLSLATLELLGHTDRDLTPPHLVQLEIDVPDDLDMDRIETDDLPSGWRRYPAPAALQWFGEMWIRRGRTPVLRVPSAVIPVESNYLLNPGHAKITRIAVVAISSSIPV